MREVLETDVKICGLRDAVAIDTAIAGGASHIGFIFFEKSPRNISLNQAGELVQRIGNGVKRVAVSVNASDAMLDEIVRAMAPDLLQLHGTELPERVAQVKARYGLPVMKALAIKEVEDFDAAELYLPVADRLLLDAKPPAGSQLPGGNGVSFDWRLFSWWQANHFDDDNLSEQNNVLDSSMMPMLSGGINRENIISALSSSNAQAIDLSSGVEVSPGVKDPVLISTLLACVKDYEQKR